MKALVYDPRRHRYVESRNPALIMADLMDKAGAEVDWGAVARQAEYLDEYVEVERNAKPPCRLTSWVDWCLCHGPCL